MKALIWILIASTAMCVIDEYYDYDHVLLSTSKSLRKPYLAETDAEYELEIKGIQYGIERRLYINMPVRLREKSCPQMINVIFEVVPSHYETTLRNEVIEKLLTQCPSARKKDSHDYLPLFVNHKLIYGQQENLPHKNRNVIGLDFLTQNGIRLTVDYSEDIYKSFTFLFEANINPEENDES